MDGSPRHWFGPQRDRACLIVFIDDVTSQITAAQFVPTENSLSYGELIEQHVWRYGIPLAFYRDRHGIFTPVGDHRTLSRNYQLTVYAHSPQAKGRIERLNKTLQGQWHHQFAYEGITDIEQTNAHIVVHYKETSKTIDYRIDEIKKREPTAEYLFTEQNQ